MDCTLKNWPIPVFPLCIRRKSPKTEYGVFFLREITDIFFEKSLDIFFLVLQEQYHVRAKTLSKISAVIART